jgi:AcrR family transcriptional regulator
MIGSVDDNGRMVMGKTHKPKAAPKKASNRPVRTPNESSLATTRRVLECAQDVLIRQGYTGFTMRAVSGAAGITPGNLAYHFPSKQMLLRAVVAHIVTGYSTQFEALLSDTKLTKGQGLKNLAQWLLTDAVDEESVRTFRELWAISLHDDVVRETVDDLYDDLMNGVVELLQRSHPDIEMRTLQEIVQLLAFFSEGSVVLYGTRRDRVVSQDRVFDILIKLLDLHAPELEIAANK